MLSSGQKFDKKFLESKHVLKVYFKLIRKKNILYTYLPVPILHGRLRILHLRNSFIRLEYEKNAYQWKWNNLWGKMDGIFIIIMVSMHIKSVWKWMSLYKWPLYDHFWPIFLPYVCSSFIKLRFWRSLWGAKQVLLMIGSKFVTQNVNIFISFFFCDFVQKQRFSFFEFFAFLYFCHNFCTN